MSPHRTLAPRELRVRKRFDETELLEKVATALAARLA